MKIKSILPILLLCGFIGNSQSILNGRVLSKSTKEPVLATVYIPSLERGIDTDFDGDYELHSIPNGTFEVVISAMGFQSFSKKIEFKDSEITFNAELTESAVEIEEVIVSTPFHRLQRENVMKVDRITMEKINSMGAITLADGIKNISGVDLVSTGTGIGKPVIRGLSSNRVLVYAQGVRLENQQFGEEHGLGINDSGVESVEVIKGPASLLYGSDALGGVLYLNPERFANVGEWNSDLNYNFYSNTSGSVIDLGTKHSLENFKFLTRGSYSSFKDYKPGDGESVINSGFEEKDFKTGVEVNLKNSKSVVRYNFNQTTVGIPEEESFGDPRRKPEVPFQIIDNHIISLDQTFFLNRSKLKMNLGFLQNNRKEFEEESGTPDLHMHLNTLNYDFKYFLPKSSKFETIIGLQGMYQENRNKAMEILIPDASIFDVGILATSHYHLDQIDFQFGIRLDNRKLNSDAARDQNSSDYIPAIDRNFTSFTAALGAKVDFTDNLIARLNLANGFRAPNLAELASNGVHEGTFRYEIGNPHLKNEHNFQIDLSLEHQDEHLEVFINGFHNSISNYIFLSPGEEVIDDYQVYHYLQQSAFLYGGEAGIHLHPHPWHWLHVESSFETVIGKLKDSNYLPLIPGSTFKNTIRIKFNEGLSSVFFTLENHLNQNKVGPFETRTGGYSLFNAGIQNEFKFKNYRIKTGISGTNLTNKKYISHLSRLKLIDKMDIGRSLNFSISFMI